MNFTAPFGTTFNFTPRPDPVYPFFQRVEIEAEDSCTVAVKGQLKIIPTGGQLTIVVKKPKPTLGQIAYEHHATSGRARLAASPAVTSVFVDTIYPSWRRLNPEDRKAWESTAGAIADAIDERQELDD